MNRALMEILVCPNCKGELLEDPKNSELICRFDKIAYPIKNDVPILIFENARRLTEEEMK